MNFEPVQISDYDRLRPFFSKQSYRLSAYSFPSIAVWSNHIYKAHYAIDGDALIIANVCTRPEDSHLLLPISPERERTPEELKRIAEEAAIRAFWYVPDEYVDRFGRDSVERYFGIEPQPDFAEYLYFSNDLALLKGNRFAAKRNWINRFTNEYGESGRVKVDLIRPGDVPECLSFLEEWCLDFTCSPDQNESLYCEKQAAIQALNNIEALGLQGILIRIDGDVHAFAIGSGLTPEIGVLSFEKARSRIKGLYQFLDRECARRLFGSFLYINKESDMGLPGLAQSKLSYHPLEKIPSHQLTLK